jgi:hypothetical protein
MKSQNANVHHDIKGIVTILVFWNNQLVMSIQYTHSQIIKMFTLLQVQESRNSKERFTIGKQNKTKRQQLSIKHYTAK